MNRQRPWVDTYFSLLRSYLETPGEELLVAAASLGKNLLSSGIPEEEVIELHEEALRRLAKELPDLPFAEAAVSTSRPLMEVFMAYGLAFRRQIEESQRANEALLQEVERRGEAEKALEEKARELARSNEDLEQFASVASHDLQAPLRQIAAFAELLTRRYRGKLDESADEMLHFVKEGASRLQRLVMDLLEYSRLGRSGVTILDLNLNSVMEQTVADLDDALREAGARVTWDPLPTVLAGRSMMSQLFSNLVGNAVKFRGEAPPEVHVGVCARDDMWVVSIRDPGSGIGLAVCKKIVEWHGGQIRVESEPGCGATFHFTLPVRGGGKHGR